MDATPSRSTHKSLNIKRDTFLVPTLALAGLAALGVGFINYNPEDFASAVDSVAVNSTVNYGDYYLSITNSTDAIDLDIDVTASGDYSYAKDDVTVTTNAPGYNLLIASSDSSNAGLKLNGTETSTNKIINASSATGGTSGTTATLSANTYGYAVPKSLACSGATCNSNFDNSYANDDLSASSKWAGIPTSSASESNRTIRTTTTATPNSGDKIDVHYGVYANNALVAGNYTGSVVYTAIANAPTEQTAIVSPTSGAAGDSVVVTSGPMIANTATLSNSDVSITIGGSTCTITNVDTSSGYLKTTCMVPSTLATGTHTVNISVSRYSYTTSISNGFTVTDPCSSGCTIHYNANSGTGSMSDQTSTSSSTTLHAQNFYRTNYGFAGWATNSSGTGTIYGPMETVDISSLVNSNKEVTFYAKWISSAGNIQDFTATTCNGMSVGSVTARKDSRNSETYAIAKLADNKCWMIENLRLGSTSNLSITTSNSVTAGTVQASSSSWGTTSSDYTKMQQNNSNITATGTASTGSNATYGYGNYYSWAQAIMSTTEYTTYGQNVSSSLYPKNWRLPTGGSSGEFKALNTAVNGDSTSIDTGLRAYPANFVYSGSWSSSSADSRGTNGYYWSSTVDGSSRAYRLYFGATNVYPGTYSTGKSPGYTVRCVIGS